MSIQYSRSSTNILYLNILYTNSGCGKREAHNNNWSMVMQRRHPLLELHLEDYTGPVPADSRQ